MARSSAGDAPGKRTERMGSRTAAVRSPLNQPVENVQMTVAHPSAGSQRRSCSRSGKLGDRAVHELEHLVAELGVDEALDLLPLRGVAAPTGVLGELASGQQVEELEHAAMGPRIAARELAIERQPQRQVGEAVLQVFRQLHVLSPGLALQLAPSPPRTCPA